MERQVVRLRSNIEGIRGEIIAHEENRAYREIGWQPLFVADPRARILVVGHAPGQKAQALGIAWQDASGEKLMDWMGVKEADFRDPQQFSLLPMDFYYQGKGMSGDLPPRKNFAPLWHPRLINNMPGLQLTILIGAYSQAYYLGKRRKKNLTETVRAFSEYLPEYFPLVHPSPLNFRWQAKNPWFEQEVLPELKTAVRKALKGGAHG